jgi:hypothetical protein
MTRRLIKGWCRQLWHTSLRSLHGCLPITVVRPTGHIERLGCTCGRVFYLREERGR